MGLCEPLQLRGRVAPSRVVFGPHVTNLGHLRNFSDGHVAYYRRRAIGGAGIIVTETASVDESDWPYERAPLSGPHNGLSDIVSACHEHGALVLASLGHCGSQGSSTYSQRALLAPSRVPDVATHDVPISMDAEDIATLIASFARAATVAIDAGADGIELDVGARSLIRQFCSGLTNQRSDRYGTDRTTLLVEIAVAVREAVGDKIVGLRFSADELAPWAGITPEQAPSVLEPVLSLIDYVAVTRGAIFSEAATTPAMADAPGFNQALIEVISEAVANRVAVIGQGSIIDVEMAEALVASGICDAVEMTRAQIADPDLVAKHRSGNRAQIRPCTLCNQRCRVLDVRNPIVSCTVNPSAGHERSDGDLGPVPTASATSTPVSVLGGGPAGLEAARCLGELGYKVTVNEAQDHLGGALALAARAPGRERLLTLVQWYESELRRLGVTIALSTTGDPSSSDAAVVAIGGRDRSLVVRDGNDASIPITTPAAILADGVPKLRGDGAICIIDPVGGPIGVSIAAVVSGAAPLVFVSPDLVVGTQLSMSGELVAANAQLANLGVTLKLHSEVVSISGGEITVEDRFSGVRTNHRVALLIDAGHRVPRDAGETTGVCCGDVIAPRTVYEAVLEGRRAAAQIAGQR